MYFIVLGLLLMAIGADLLGIVFIVLGIAKLATENQIKADMPGISSMGNSMACPPHRWACDKDGKMFCATCNITPS